MMVLRQAGEEKNGAVDCLAEFCLLAVFCLLALLLLLLRYLSRELLYYKKICTNLKPPTLTQ